MPKMCGSLFFVLVSKQMGGFSYVVLVSGGINSFKLSAYLHAVIWNNVYKWASISLLILSASSD